MNEEIVKAFAEIVKKRNPRLNLTDEEAVDAATTLVAENNSAIVALYQLLDDIAREQRG